MSLVVAIQMDPIESINIDADSTFALALEAQRRGHQLYHYLTPAMSFSQGAFTPAPTRSPSAASPATITRWGMRSFSTSPRWTWC